MRYGRPREPGKAFKNVGVFARDLKNAVKKSGQTAFRYPVNSVAALCVDIVSNVTAAMSN